MDSQWNRNENRRRCAREEGGKAPTAPGEGAQSRGGAGGALGAAVGTEVWGRSGAAGHQAAPAPTPPLGSARRVAAPRQRRAWKQNEPKGEKHRCAESVPVPSLGVSAGGEEEDGKTRSSGAGSTERGCSPGDGRTAAGRGGESGEQRGSERFQERPCLRSHPSLCNWSGCGAPCGGGRRWAAVRPRKHSAR